MNSKTYVLSVTAMLLPFPVQLLLKSPWRNLSPRKPLTLFWTKREHIDKTVTFKTSKHDSIIRYCRWIGGFLSSVQYILFSVGNHYHTIQGNKRRKQSKCPKAGTKRRRVVPRSGQWNSSHLAREHRHDTHTQTEEEELGSTKGSANTMELRWRILSPRQWVLIVSSSVWRKENSVADPRHSV